MLRLRAIFYLSAISVLITACGQTVDPNSRTLLEFGLPPREDYLNARNVVADKWGFGFESMAGCVVTDHLIDSIKTHNSVVQARLDSLFGADWGGRFETEVEKELEIERKVRGLLDAQSYIRSQDSLMNIEGNGLHYILSSPDTSGTYETIVYGWGSGNGTPVLSRFFLLKVHPDLGTVVLISDKLEPLE